MRINAVLPAAAGLGLLTALLAPLLVRLLRHLY